MHSLHGRLVSWEHSANVDSVLAGTARQNTIGQRCSSPSAPCRLRPLSCDLGSGTVVAVAPRRVGRPLELRVRPPPQLEGDGQRVDVNPGPP
jgi:hypothetical protein